jgi:hypothetical protein
VTPDEILAMLKALGEQLDAANAEPVELLVCGGTAMNLRGLTARATKDVDVVAVVSQEAGLPPDRLRSARPLPPAVVAARNRVARDFGVSEEWLNDGPASVMDFGLPEGCLARTAVLPFGSRLVVRVLGEFDLICLKLEALADTDVRSRHFQDLVALRPTPEVLRAACAWILSHNEPEGFLDSLKGALNALGASDVARELG